jgi:hypothetical protein
MPNYANALAMAKRLIASSGRPIKIVTPDLSFISQSAPWSGLRSPEDVLLDLYSPETIVSAYNATQGAVTDYSETNPVQGGTPSEPINTSVLEDAFQGQIIHETMGVFVESELINQLTKSGNYSDSNHSHARGFLVADMGHDWHKATTIIDGEKVIQIDTRECLKPGEVPLLWAMEVKL